MKLLDALKDIEVSEFDYDIINGNAHMWVRNKLTEKIADELWDEYKDWSHEHPESKVDIDREELKERVLDKLADRIIEQYLEDVR